MCIVNEAVQDRVAVGRINNGPMPTDHWKLAGNQGEALTVAVFENFQEMMAAVAVKRLEAPIVQDQ